MTVREGLSKRRRLSWDLSDEQNPFLRRSALLELFCHSAYLVLQTELCPLQIHSQSPNPTAMWLFWDSTKKEVIKVNGVMKVAPWPSGISVFKRRNIRDFTLSSLFPSTTLPSLCTLIPMKGQARKWLLIRNNWLIPWSWANQLPHLWDIYFCCLSFLVCGTLL